MLVFKVGARIAPLLSFLNEGNDSKVGQAIEEIEKEFVDASLLCLKNASAMSPKTATIKSIFSVAPFFIYIILGF